MAIPALTLLVAAHGFDVSGAHTCLNTDGYLALIPGFQRAFFADGRPWTNDIDTTGYHKLDFLNTRIVGTVTGVFNLGEVVNQATSLAQGIFIESVTRDGVTWTLIYRTTETEFIAAVAIIGAESAASVTPAAAGNIVSPPHWLAWDTAPSVLEYDFEGECDTGTNATHLVDASLGADYTINDFINDWYVYITSGLGKGSYAQVTAYVASTGTITVADWLKENGDAGGVDPDDTSSYGLSQIPIETTGGIFPDGGSNIGMICFGRIFLNSMLSPHLWFCSRVEEPNDWDTGQDDNLAATSSQNASTGEVGDVLTAMIAYKDHYGIFGYTNSIWCLRSDPLQGGISTCLSKTTGIFSPVSYCWDDKNNLYFLGTDGIYKLSADAIIAGAPPENITKVRLPKLVTSLGLNRKTDRVTMGFDKQRYGIEISISQLDGTWGVCFWLDIRTGGLFPDVFPSGTVNPSCLFYYDAVKASERGLLIGGYDGFLRRFDEAVKDDDGTTIESYAVLGPFVSDSETRSKGTLNEVAITPGKGTDSITVDLHRADNADELINNIEADVTPIGTKVFTGDQPGTIRDKVSGRAIAMVLKNLNADESWSMESVDIDLKTSGKQK